MRKIARTLLPYVRSGQPRTVGNTRVESAGNATVVRLHGNAIMRLTPTEAPGALLVEVSLAGWPTPTTRSRLNDLLWGLFAPLDGPLYAPHVSQRAGDQLLWGSGTDRTPVLISPSGWYAVGGIPDQREPA